MTPRRVQCERCGIGFSAVNSTARFCSAKCRVYAHRHVPVINAQAQQLRVRIAELAAELRNLRHDLNLFRHVENGSAVNQPYRVVGAASGAFKRAYPGSKSNHRAAPSSAAKP